MEGKEEVASKPSVGLKELVEIDMAECLWSRVVFVLLVAGYNQCRWQEEGSMLRREEIWPKTHSINGEKWFRTSKPAFLVISL